MNNKSFAVSKANFLMMSETHLKTLAMQGIQVVIEDYNTNPTYNKVVDNNKGTTTKVVSKPANKVSKPTTKGSKKDSKAVKPTTKKLAFGKVKQGDYIAMYNLTTNKVANVGYIKSIDKDSKAAVCSNGKKYAIENCVKITKAEYKKLKPSFKKAATKTTKTDSKKAKLSAKDYKAVYCFYLKSLGKITEDDFKNSINDDNKLDELYKKFKADVKLINADAMKLYAENSAKVSA